MVKAATGGTRTAARTVQGLSSTSKLPSSSLTPRSSQSHIKVRPKSGSPGICTTTTRTSASMERDISVRSSKPRSCLGPSLYYFDLGSNDLSYIGTGKVNQHIDRVITIALAIMYF